MCGGKCEGKCGGKCEGKCGGECGGECSCKKTDIYITGIHVALAKNGKPLTEMLDEIRNKGLILDWQFSKPFNIQVRQVDMNSSLFPVADILHNLGTEGNGDK